MTFEDALKRLAEKEPEKFFISDYHDVSFSFVRHGKCELNPLAAPTQDDLDEILALIGFAYHIKPKLEWWGKGNKIQWVGVPIKLSSLKADYGTAPLPTKLDAAKAALIAVVEKLYGKD